MRSRFCRGVPVEILAVSVMEEILMAHGTNVNAKPRWNRMTHIELWICFWIIVALVAISAVDYLMLEKSNAENVKLEIGK